ncbi:MAG: hypothetical protein ACRD1V_20445, partial [Vicinamibacterales bacterium]
MRTGRAAAFHSWPTWLPVVWLIAGMAALVFATSCNHDIPVVDVGSRPANARATIFGTVRGPDGTSPVVGRPVEIVNV